MGEGRAVGLLVQFAYVPSDGIARLSRDIDTVGLGDVAINGI